MSRTADIAGRTLAFGKTVLVGLAYIAAVLGIALGGIALASRAMVRWEENPPPAGIVLDSGLGRICIPAPAGTDGTLHLTPPPLGPGAYEAWEEERCELECSFPYAAELFLPVRNPSLAHACEYYEPCDASSNACPDVTCRLLVFAAPGGEAASWEDFLADGRELEQTLAAEADREGKPKRVFAVGERAYGYDTASDALADSVRFVWVAGCRFVLRCQDEGVRNVPPLDRSVFPAVLDGWIGSICAAAGIAPRGPDEDETARGNAWAAERRKAGDAAIRSLEAAEKSGLAGIRRILRHAWIWVGPVLFVTGIGCLSVTVVWGLLLAVALAVFGRKRPAGKDERGPKAGDA